MLKQYAIAFLCAIALCTAISAVLVPLLKKKKAEQTILQYVAEHNSKQGTPTMGGIAFIITVALLALLFNTNSRPLYVMMAVFVGYGIIGLLDDGIKIKMHHNMGLRAYQKIIVQLVIATLVALYVYNEPSIGSVLRIPFTDKEVDIKGWTIPLVIFIYLACTNGVNLTDGLDGLATSTTLCYMCGMVALLVVERNRLYMLGDTLAMQRIEETTFVAIIAVGAMLAFLLFNAFPAKVFMGDAGSLALGALVACVAIFSRMSLYIPILGIMFVVSCVSVIMQVVYFKATKGKRIFLMAPYHHHLQHKGLSETRIATIYSVITLAIATLLLIFGA